MTSVDVQRQGKPWFTCAVELDEKQDVLNGSRSPAVQAFVQRLSAGDPITIQGYRSLSSSQHVDNMDQGRTNPIASDWVKPILWLRSSFFLIRYCM